MAKLTPCILLCGVALGLSVPTTAQAAQRLRPQGLVNDFAGVMSPQILGSGHRDDAPRLWGAPLWS